MAFTQERPSTRRFASMARLVPRGTTGDSARAWVLAGSMLSLLSAPPRPILAALRSRRDLVLENVAVSQ